jgi:hypothetical protein
VKNWLKEIQTYAPKNVKILLVGNKSDLKTERVVDVQTGQEFADKRGIQFIETSAKTPSKVDEAFMMLFKQIRKADMGEIISIDNSVEEFTEKWNLNHPENARVDLNDLDIHENKNFRSYTQSVLSPDVRHVDMLIRNLCFLLPTKGKPFVLMPVDPSAFEISHEERILLMMRFFHDQASSEVDKKWKNSSYEYLKNQNFYNFIKKSLIVQILTGLGQISENNAKEIKVIFTKSLLQIMYVRYVCDRAGKGIAPVNFSIFEEVLKHEAVEKNFGDKLRQWRLLNRLFQIQWPRCVEREEQK